MERLGGWRRERVSGRPGLTLAGLLMFGSERSLLDALPHYHLDYQEQLSADPEQRWSHRITVDVKCAPNLFNFYYRVYPRLVEGLDVPRVNRAENGASIRMTRESRGERLRAPGSGLRATPSASPPAQWTTDYLISICTT